MIKNNVNNEHEKKRECNYDKKEREKNIKGNEEVKSNYNNLEELIKKFKHKKLRIQKLSS